MKTIIKNTTVLMLLVLFSICLSFSCLAATQQGKITVILEDKQNNKLNSATVKICRIAHIDNSGYYPTKDFENSGISISGIINNPNETAAKTIADYIKNNNISAISAVSENGKATFSELELGIWLVYSDENGKYTFNPYIVFLPFESGGKLYYELSSTPKVDESNPNEISIYVMKKWDDKNNASKKRPDFITVELLNDEKVITSVELSEANGWAHTFTKLSKSENYSVREKKVTDYKVSYSGDAANGFIITNTYAGEKLPQTGQYWWPIIIIAIAGAGFILLGIYEVGAKKNDKKK